MTVWIVEREHDDSYYGSYLEDIFSTEELAKEYIEFKHPTEKKYYEITEVEVRDSLQ